MKNRLLKVLALACALGSFAVPAFAVDPTSMTEVAGVVTTGLSSNGFLYAIMGGVMTLTVIIMLFMRGKKVAK